MPPKIRELKQMLHKVGFYELPGKGSHTNWVHPLYAGKIYMLEKSQFLVKTEQMQNGIKRRKYSKQLRKLRERRMPKLKYSMVIQWSDEDDCFLVGFPDFPGQRWRTHGDTYELAVANGIEALEALIIAYSTVGDPLPEPTVCKAA